MIHILDADSMGLASMFVEAAVVSLSLARLGMGRRWMQRLATER